MNDLKANRENKDNNVNDPARFGVRSGLSLLLAALLLLPVGAIVGAGSHGAGPAPDPEPDDHHLYHSLINWQFDDPSDLNVIVVPSVFFSEPAMLDDTDWLTGGDPLNDYPGIAAIAEAVNYWEWMLAQYTDTWPVLEQIGWNLRIVGIDALPQDIATADIVVVSWMAHGPAPSSFHLGVGLPVPYPTPSTQTKCVVYNSGLGWNSDVPVTRLRNLAVHEFGHCISAGHTYDTNNSDRLTSENDVMAAVNGAGRQCLSNLNVKSVAEGYGWLVDPGQSPGSGSTTIPVEEYEQQCVPDHLVRF